MLKISVALMMVLSSLGLASCSHGSGQPPQAPQLHDPERNIALAEMNQAAVPPELIYDDPNESFSGIVSKSPIDPSRRDIVKVLWWNIMFGGQLSKKLPGNPL